MKTAKATRLTCWEQYISSALGSKFTQRLSPTALRTRGFHVPPVCQRQRQVTSQTVRNFVKIIELTGNCAAENATETVQTTTNGEDDDDKPPREVPTSAKMRNLLRLLQNQVHQRGRSAHVMHQAAAGGYLSRPEHGRKADQH
ncbi:hypothetical protein HPB50_016261 [Hyalomma asiaticum]|uniref:Uncharacterized protein n=1 Tax=Hyalomma asiaticum TaxID=266040 RepID=A0ACB7TIF7_HYAAI|nr:hypothetical protein HPB50_016261 [Hyalomma asiaticum]